MPYPNPYLPQSAGQQYAPYQPQGYMTAGTSPMLVQQQQQQQPIHGFVYVTGVDGAKAYQMPPNSEMPLFDSTGERDRMYIKTTDGAGFPTLIPCKVIRLTEPEAQPESEYVTRDELDRTYRDLAEQLERIKEVIHVPVPTTAGVAEPNAGTPTGNQADGGWESARHASTADA